MASFFISYTQADQEWAEWIAYQLRDAGHKPVLRAWHFRSGGNFIIEMHRAAAGTDRTIAVISPNYLESAYGTPEWAVAIWRDPSGEDRILVPVMVRETELVGLLGPLTRINLVGLDEAAARERLLNELDEAPAIPSTKPTFPGQASTGTTLADAGPALKPVLFDESHGQHRWLLPPTIDQGLHRAATIAREHRFLLRAWTDDVFPDARLRDYAAVILIGAPQGAFKLSGEEISGLQRYVADGGGLLLMATFTGDWHHESNLNDILRNYGMEFNRDLIMPDTAVVTGTQDDGRIQVGAFGPASRYVVEAQPFNGHLDELTRGLTEGVRTILALSSCSVGIRGGAEEILRTVETSQTFEPLPSGIGVAIDRYEVRRVGPAPILAVSRRGAGRIAAIGGFKMFLDRFMEHPGYDNARLFTNLLQWIAHDI